MLIDDQIFGDEWFCSLPQRQKLLYMYLLCVSSKCGIFELNMRKINFDLTNGVEDVKPYTADEILNFGGDRIEKVGETRAIITGYIARNWARDKPLNPAKNPLHKGLRQELAKYGLDFEEVNRMSKKKFAFVSDEEVETNEMAESYREATEEDKLKSVPNAKEWFEEFWKSYPSSCPRKVDKKKCALKYARLLRDAGTSRAEEMHKSILAGLEVWKQSEMWKSNGGQYIKAPLVWLNGACWNDTPMKGNGNGNVNGNGVKRSANAIGTGNSDIQDLF